MGIKTHIKLYDKYVKKCKKTKIKPMSFIEFIIEQGI